MWVVKGAAEEGVGCWFSGRRPSVHRPSLGAPCLVACTLHLPGLSSSPEVIKHPTSAWPEVDGLGTGHFLSGQSVSPRDQ